MKALTRRSYLAATPSSNETGANIRVDMPCYWIAFSRGFNAPNEVSDDFDVIGVLVAYLKVSELIFDQYQQFQTIKPVDSEIVSEVRFVRNARDVDAKMLGNQRTDFAPLQAFPSP